MATTHRGVVESEYDSIKYRRSSLIQIIPWSKSADMPPANIPIKTDNQINKALLLRVKKRSTNRCRLLIKKDEIFFSIELKAT